MTGPYVSIAAQIFLIAATLIVTVNLATLLAAIWRGMRERLWRPPSGSEEPVTIVRPLSGLEPFSRETLESTFLLDHCNYEIIFCVARPDDPVIAIAAGLIGKYPHIPARLLIGDVKVSQNPKLNNCVAGWQAARHELIILADSNVLMPADYVARLTRHLAPDVALVSAPPAGSHPQSRAAEWELAFLNSFQARWQLGADSFGFGFAQGKNMLFRKSVVENHGGIAALGDQPAEDAAATKMMHRAGWRVAVVDRPFPQPLGARRWRDVWSRQARWAQLRRATFPGLFAMEILSGSLMPAVLFAAAAALAGHEFVSALVAGLVLLYGLELCACQAQGWKWNWRSPFLFLLRDMSLPVLWAVGYRKRGFEWHGHAMTATTAQQR